jgi:D-sedoheptulose 7-phosphate isomerase
MNGPYPAAQLISERLKDSIAVKRAILEDSQLIEIVEAVAELCACTIRRNGKIIMFGNGGSAADAQHLAAELVGRYMRERRALAGVALTNTSCLTAIGNDYSYDEVFSRQIEAIGTKGDVAIGISTSGNSKNVVRALRTAKAIGMATVGMTGSSGGQVKHEADYCVCVPSAQTPRIQEAHIVLGHILCELVEADVVDASNIPRS